MKRITKRIISVVAVLALTLALAIPVFAADSITPSTGTQIVYLTSTDTSVISHSYISLASGTKNFTIKRTETKVAPGTTGAKMTTFNKNINSYNSTSSYSISGKWNTTTYSSSNCNYSADFSINKPGTATVSYKIGTKTYKTKLKVLAYKNPVKSITLTGINGGKNFASLTKSSANISKKLSLKTTTKNAQLNITPTSGWKISSVSISDSNTTLSRSVSNYRDGLSSAKINWGTLNKSHSYNISVTFFNTSNHASIHIYYPIN